MTDEEYIKMSTNCSDHKEKSVEEDYKQDEDQPNAIEVTIYSIIFMFAILYFSFMR